MGRARAIVESPERQGRSEEALIHQTFIGQHPRVLRVLELIERVSNTSATVLVSGESGTGKELIARSIHRQSDRRAGPFVPVHCGAIPKDLQESELFGHRRGSFTGATADRPGLFAVADGGTLFLDEVGETAPSLQAKLLRALQDHQIRPVGADGFVQVDVRVIAATNRNLEAEVHEGRFREDLFYRLHVVPIHMPALRERRSDIPLLVEHFIRRWNATHDEAHSLRLGDDAMLRLWEHDWPGNVRELENLLERVAILAGGEVVTAQDLPLAHRNGATAPNGVDIGEEGFSLAAAVREYEDHLIDRALKRTGGNKQAAARLLGMKRTTLLAKLDKRADHPRSSPPALLD